MNLEERFKTYIEKLKGQEGFFARDIDVIEFFAKNSSNDKPDDVRMKVTMISDRSLTEASAVEDMVNHIVSLKIDSKLKANDLGVVEEIAKLTVRGGQKKFLRFASLYCNFHKPDVYPIYSDEHLDLYRKYITDNKLAVNPAELDQYLVFKKVLDDALKRYDVNAQLNYQETRKLGWLYIDKILQEE